MKIRAAGFSAIVNLPCRVFVGPRCATEYSGVATSLESGRVLVSLLRAPMPQAGDLEPDLAPGDEVQLDMALPIQVEWAQAKSLHVRAKVASLQARSDGVMTVELRFRKPVFRDRVPDGNRSMAARAPNAAGGWKM